AMMYKVIKRKISTDLGDEVRQFIVDNDIKGVYLEPDSQRSYPYTSLAAQVVGFVSSDNVGAEGLEAYYNNTMEGVGGEIITTKGNEGSQMLYTYEKYYDADNGNNLVLTLDTSVQYYLEKNMEIAIEKYDVLNGAFGIVMDVNTGAVVAMANLGSYDPNNYVEVYDQETATALEQQYLEAMLLEEGSVLFNDSLAAYNAAVATARLQQWRNKTVSDGYEPGSTFKIITMAAALEESAISLTDEFYCGGSTDIEGREQTLHCWRTEGHGVIDTSGALEGSCNIAFANIALAMGGETMYDYVSKFGFLEKTGIDLPGEAVGYFYNEEQLADNNTYGTSYLTSASFGQTFKITPVQLVTAISAVVNGGYLMEPYIVDQVLDDDGNVVEQHETTVVRQVISEETSSIMRTMLESVVTEGTASNAATIGYAVGGKTGTSEKIDVFDENGVAVEDKIVSFVGVAPIDDPQYVVLVALDTPSTATGYYISGGIMAAPTVRDVFTDILPYLGIEPNYEGESLSSINIATPNVTGLALAEAITTTTNAGLSYRVVGDGGTVTDQIPSAGWEIPGESQMVFYLGEEKPTEGVVVPDFTGLGTVQVNDLAVELGIYVQAKGTENTGSAVSVTYQDYEAGMEVPLGTTVTVEFTDHSAQD
ncbi:MAG: penicillin-binding transpeptidase domain-containing protein, partial [Eubacteriales bacterium]